jgi:tRNA (guanine37-N1)-methyltransferase
MIITILTICPELFGSFLDSHVIKRAASLEQLKVHIMDIRNFAGGSFRHVDDSPYGGGSGMILRAGPVLDALAAAGKGHCAALIPTGKKYTQADARRLSALDHLILVCGHYEGMDARIYGHADELISIGDYVITGGELAAMVVTDSIARLLPGVVKDTVNESFGTDGQPEGPQYTRPADLRGEKVPEVLLSGNHEAIAAWRKEQALLWSTKKSQS